MPHRGYEQSDEHLANRRRSLLRRYAIGDPDILADIITEIFSQVVQPELRKPSHSITPGDPYAEPDPPAPRPVFSREGVRRSWEPTDEDVEMVRNVLLAGFRNASVDSSAWDAELAWRSGEAAPSPAIFFRGICAGHRSGDPSTREYWALPHHYHPEDPPNEAGVRDALSRLDQTQGLVNPDDAHIHLIEHMRIINPDYVPSHNLSSSEIAAKTLVLLKMAQTLRNG